MFVRVGPRAAERLAEDVWRLRSRDPVTLIDDEKGNAGSPEPPRFIDIALNGGGVVVARQHLAHIVAIECRVGGQVDERVVVED